MKEVQIEGKLIKISHPDKILFPDIGITKSDIVDYYLKIADYILPSIKDRALTLYCVIENIEEDGYYRQHAPLYFPKWINTYELKKKTGGTVNHILCSDRATLIYLVNYHMIGLHRWLSLIQRPENPDIAIIEIHSLSSEYSQVYKAAKLIREELEIAGFQPYLMTTGIGGLYVISKVVYNCSFDDIRHVMYNITLKIANKFPQEFSVDVHKKDRNELVYLDVTRNSYGQSSIVPYSVAPQKNATVATPIHWEEIENSNFSLDQFNINNIFLRLTPNIITS